MSKPGTPVICLETEERFESMKEAMERYGVSSGSLNSALTSRLIDFKYLREAEAPAYTHGVSNDILDYEFDDDDDDIPAFSFPEA